MTAIDSNLVSETQLAQLAGDGFFITEPLFPVADLAAVAAEFTRLSAGPPDRVGGNFACFLHRTNPVCAEFCRHPVFAALCRQLLGPEVYQTWNQMIVKRPGQAGRFAWHQDAYYGVYNPDGSIGPEDPADDFTTGVITMWVAITRTTVDNGCLWALPGAHRHGLLPHHWDRDEKAWVGDYDTSGAVAAELDPGQIFVFTRLTPHSSGPNISDTVRMGYQIGYATTIGIRDMIPFLRDGRRLGDGSGGRPDRDARRGHPRHLPGYR